MSIENEFQKIISAIEDLPKEFAARTAGRSRLKRAGTEDDYKEMAREEREIPVLWRQLSVAMNNLGPAIETYQKQVKTDLAERLKKAEQQGKSSLTEDDPLLRRQQHAKAAALQAVRLAVPDFEKLLDELNRSDSQRELRTLIQHLDSVTDNITKTLKTMLKNLGELRSFSEFR